MEALGVASGTAGLIALAEIIATKGYKYYTRAKGARSEINDFVLEIQRLYAVLNQLRLLAICLEAEESSEEASLNASRLDHFQSCWKILHELNLSLATVDSNSTKDKLIWPFKTTETKELVQKIARSRDHLSAALNADGLTALLTALSSTARVLDTVQEGVEFIQTTLRETADEIIRQEQDELKNKVYSWCSAVNPYDKHEISKTLRHPNTVLWFFDCDEYKSWMEEDNSSIWIYGIPGAGKTILTCAVIEEAKSLVAKTPGLALAYFYCENKSKGTQVLSNIIGSLIKQLSAVSPEAYDELFAYYQTCTNDYHSSNAPKAEDLRKLLMRISRYFDSVLVIIDGIDECEELNERSAILEFLSAINSPQSGTIKVLCTSRNEIDIKNSLAGFKSISIAARGSDLELFVSATIEARTRNKTLRIRDPLLKGEITNKIVSKANGMFQWAKCQIDQICLLSNDKQRRKALETLPKDLFETYQRILERLLPESQALAQRSLRWISFAGLNLDVSGLLTAVAVDIGADCVDQDEVADEESILQVCSSLVSKTHYQLVLSHFTVKEFLTDEKLLEIPSLRQYYLDATRSHAILARVCLNYLTMSYFTEWRLGESGNFQKADDLQENYPLLRYATNKWDGHFKNSKEDESCTETLRQLFNPLRTTNFLTWLHLLYMFARIPVPKNVSTLHVAAHLGLESMCRWLIEQGANVNLVDKDLGTPLLFSIKPGRLPFNFQELNPAVVRLLLENGAKGNKEFQLKLPHSSSSGQPLEVHSPISITLDRLRDSASNGVGQHNALEILQDLVHFGAVSPFAKSWFWSVIEEKRAYITLPDSVFSRLMELFGRMLEIPLCHNLDDATKSKILVFMTVFSNKTNMCLAKPVTTFELSSGTVKNVLYTAGLNGENYFIESYVERGVDPEILAMAILGAVNGYQPDIIKNVLQRCPLKSKGVSKIIRGAWFSCVARSNVEIMELLLDYGQDPNDTVCRREFQNYNEWGDEYGDHDACSYMENEYTDEDTSLEQNIRITALTAAIEAGAAEVVEFLASYPLNQVDFLSHQNGENMLFLAMTAPMDHFRIVTALLQKEVDPLATNANGDTLLHRFFRKTFGYALQGHEDTSFELVQLLVSRGCSLAKLDHGDNSLLHCVFSNRFWNDRIDVESTKAIVQLLIEAFDSREIANKDGDLPLHLAVVNQLPAFIVTLAIPTNLVAWNSKNLRNTTPLHLAVDLRNISLYRDYDCFVYALPILDALLSVADVDIDILDEHGDTPLLMAALTSTCELPAIGSQVIGRLLQSGANVNAAITDNQSTVAHILAQSGSFEQLKEVLKFGPCLYNLVTKGYSPLHFAIYYGHFHCVQLLLEYENKLDSQGLLPEDFDKSIGHKTSRGASPIAIASMRGRCEILRLLHAHGQINATDDLDNDGMTPLFYAIKNNHLATVKSLTELGANLVTTFSDGATYLHIAASLGFKDIIETLLESGADPGAEDIDGVTPWMYAASNGHTPTQAILEQALKEKHGQEGTVSITALEQSVTVAELSSETLLHNPTSSLLKSAEIMIRAIGTTNTALCLVLLEKGFDVNQSINDQNETCLHCASCIGDGNGVEIVGLLLAWKADVTLRDKEGRQPLHCACYHLNYPVIKLLLEHGAQIKSKSHAFGASPLHITAQNGGLNSVKTILTHASLLGIKQECLEMFDNDRRTPLILAMKSQNLEMSKLLIAEGANIHTRDIYGDGMLQLAGRFADKEFIYELIYQGLDVNPSDVRVYTALHCVIERYITILSTEKVDEINELAHLLLNAGCNISSENLTKTSPLHVACHSGHKTLVKELLNRIEEHEINVVSLYFGTPLFIAASTGHTSIVKLLLENGADPTIEREGETPLQAAKMQENEEVVKILEEWMARKVEETRESDG